MVLRLASAAIGLPLILLLVWRGGLWFTSLVAFAAVVAASEVSQMAKLRGEQSFTPIAALLAGVLISAAHILVSSPGRAEIWAIAATALGIAAAIGMISKLSTLKPLSHVTATVGAIFYPGGLLFLAPLLRAIEQGREWILFIVLVTFATDTSAFLLGKAIGRHPLAPTISPSKTIEGAFGGVVGAMAAAAAARYVFSLDADLVQVLALGGLIGVIGQIGDLIESRLKRNAGVKDSGWIIPGHGGILDRLDSIVFNLVVVYFFVIWVIT